MRTDTRDKADLRGLLKERQASVDPQHLGNWDVRGSGISGRGVFATRGIQSGEVIFIEEPLAVGPRSAALPACCTACGRLGRLDACDGGCRLPVCSEGCSTAHRRLPECSYLSGRVRGSGGDWSPLIYRSLAPLRCLFLTAEEKAILRALSQNRNNKHLELKLLNMELCENSLGKDETRELELICRILNGVAFEVEVDRQLSVSWRALSPLAGTLNHSCSPNTQHTASTAGLTMRAARGISEGEELTTSYCPLLWSTPARRHFLYLTKEFLCHCPRCTDPTEYGSYFSSSDCECGGRLLPREPLDAASPWSCDSCSRPSLTLKQVLLKDASSSAVSLHRPLQHTTVKRNIELVWKIGYGKKPYKDVTDEELEKKLTAIKELTEVNNILRLGESRLKDSLSTELHNVMDEIAKRNSSNS